eukprot:3498362-Prymnesium_polylepis.1
MQHQRHMSHMRRDRTCLSIQQPRYLLIRLSKSLAVTPPRRAMTDELHRLAPSGPMRQDQHQRVPVRRGNSSLQRMTSQTKLCSHRVSRQTGVTQERLEAVTRASSRCSSQSMHKGLPNRVPRPQNTGWGCTGADDALATVTRPSLLIRAPRVC